MRIDILTLFPEMFDALRHSIFKRAVANGVISLYTHNIRDFADNIHKQTDDYPFGGGAGMVMTPQPIFDCMKHVESLCKRDNTARIYLSPRGEKLSSRAAESLAGKDLILLCGHYEGVDQRVIDTLIDTEISIGDYVLTGGELAAMVLVDCVSRYIPNVLGSEASAGDESFSDGLLEYPQYTRPADYMGYRVPEILLSGHHANIQKWRKDKSLEITRQRRPDLLQ